MEARRSISPRSRDANALRRHGPDRPVPRDGESRTPPRYRRHRGTRDGRCPRGAANDGPARRGRGVDTSLGTVHELQRRGTASRSDPGGRGPSDAASAAPDPSAAASTEPLGHDLNAAAATGPLGRIPSAAARVPAGHGRSDPVTEPVRRDRNAVVVDSTGLGRSAAVPDSPRPGRSARAAAIVGRDPMRAEKALVGSDPRSHRRNDPPRNGVIAEHMSRTDTDQRRAIGVRHESARVHRSKRGLSSRESEGGPWTGPRRIKSLASTRRTTK